MTSVANEINRTLFFADLPEELPAPKNLNQESDDQSLETQETLVETIGRTLFFTDLELEPVGSTVNKIDLSDRPLILDIPDNKKHEVEEPTTSVLDEIQKALFFTDIPDEYERIIEIKKLKMKERVLELKNELERAEMAVDKIRIEAHKIQIKETKLELARQDKVNELSQAKKAAETFEQALIMKKKEQQQSKTEFLGFDLGQWR